MKTNENLYLKPSPKEIRLNVSVETSACYCPLSILVIYFKSIYTSLSPTKPANTHLKVYVIIIQKQTNEQLYSLKTIVYPFYYYTHK